jgi:outer membrane lipoprotein-sorting protein
MFKNSFKTLFFIGAVMAGSVCQWGALSHAYAAESAQSAMPEIAKAEAYLNAMKRLKARFVITANDGSQLKGHFYLNRPGKLRFNFDPPVKDFIVADGRFIYFYDDALGEQSNAPIGTTLADFLLREHISLDGDVKVERIMRAAGLVQISLSQKDDPGAGQLILGFDEESFALQKWRVIDSLGNITEVALLDADLDPVFEEGLFYYLKPKSAGEEYNE